MNIAEGVRRGVVALHDERRRKAMRATRFRRAVPLPLQSQPERSPAVHERLSLERSHEFSVGCEARQSRKRRGLGSQA